MNWCRIQCPCNNNDNYRTTEKDTAIHLINLCACVLGIFELFTSSNDNFRSRSPNSHNEFMFYFILHSSWLKHKRLNAPQFIFAHNFGSHWKSYNIIWTSNEHLKVIFSKHSGELKLEATGQWMFYHRFEFYRFLVSCWKTWCEITACFGPECFAIVFTYDIFMVLSTGTLMIPHSSVHRSSNMLCSTQRYGNCPKLNDFLWQILDTKHRAVKHKCAQISKNKRIVGLTCSINTK